MMGMSIGGAGVAVSKGYRAWILEQLGRIAPVEGRAMFGGLGLYAGGAFFALVDDDRLYFKVDEATRPRYREAGMGAFDPFQDGRTMEGYYEVPGEVLEDAERLGPWMAEALQVAARGKPAPRKRKAKP